MPTTILKKKSILIVFLLLAFHLLSYQSQAQQKRVEIAEMKDTVNGYITKIRDMEKEKKPDESAISKARERLMVLLILNSNTACGPWPSPSGKIEMLEEYWKCVFEKAPYGKKFNL